MRRAHNSNGYFRRTRGSGRRLTAGPGSGGGAAAGPGDQIVGSIPIGVLGGATQLTLIAGAGGEGRNGTPAPRGGMGYGNGGNGVGTTGGGGGGSAILLGGSPTGTPLVVAGGGGGGAQGQHKVPTPSVDVNFDGAAGGGGNVIGPNAGHGFTGDGGALVFNGVTETSLTGGLGGTLSAGGQPATISGSPTVSSSGFAGSGHTSSGGNGGNGAPIVSVPIGNNAAGGGGGGGGGYTGGAGGSNIYWLDSPSSAWGQLAAGGGGGSSFVASGVTVTHDAWGPFPSDANLPGIMGSVMITFVCV